MATSTPSKRNAAVFADSLTVTGESSVSNITASGTVTASGGNSTNWNTAYSWGNHASAGYLTSILTPVNGDWWNNGFVRVGADGVMEVGKYLDFHTADSGGSTDYDLRVTATPGALSVGGTIAATGGNSTNWNTAYGWGNHASAGYLTSYTETDTLDSVTDRGATTTNAVTVGNLTSTGIDDNATSTAITIDSSQNIGIGASSPAAKLDVNGSIQAVQTTGTKIALGATTFVSGSSTIADYGITYNDEGLSFDTNLAGFTNMKFHTNRTERLRISPNGNVGIGTTNPTTALDVNGTVTATSFSGDGSNLTGISAGVTTGKAIAMAIVFG